MQDTTWSEAFDFGRLVPVENRKIGSMTGPTVIARDVHTFIGFTGRVASWFDDQVTRCSLAIGTDYQEVFLPQQKNSRRGRPRRNYALTLAAAKKIAMASEGPRGAAVREYFLEQERRLLAGEEPLQGSSSPETPPATTKTYFERKLAHAASMYYPLATYLDWAGVPGRLINNAINAFERELVNRLNHLSNPPEVMRDPLTNRWIFKRTALDTWWELNAADILERCKADHPGFGPHWSASSSKPPAPIPRGSVHFHAPRTQPPGPAPASLVCPVPSAP